MPVTRLMTWLSGIILGDLFLWTLGFQRGNLLKSKFLTATEVQAYQDVEIPRFNGRMKEIHKRRMDFERKMGDKFFDAFKEAEILRIAKRILGEK